MTQQGIEMAGHVLILGGEKSGKTSFAEQMAIRIATKICYVATTDSLTSEMADRIASHRAKHAAQLSTVTVPLALPDALITAAKHHDLILVDCVTLWIGNLLKSNADVAGAVGELASVLVQLKGTKVILVSTEMGMGTPPDDATARTFRDLTGAAHQRLVQSCEEVYFVVAGLPVALKRGGDGASLKVELPYPS
jgi:adenosylcobinamide kinase/adenosylcobinamide-phosphate guanylyltransferase